MTRGLKRSEIQQLDYLYAILNRIRIEFNMVYDRFKEEWEDEPEATRHWSVINRFLSSAQTMIDGSLELVMYAQEKYRRKDSDE